MLPEGVWRRLHAPAALLLLMVLFTIHASEGRQLRATITARATSFGGRAESRGHAAGNAKLDVTTVALNNGTAVANKDLQAGNGTVISLADGNNTYKYDSTHPAQDPTAASPQPAANGSVMEDPAPPADSPAPALESPAPNAASPAPGDDAPTTNRVSRTWEAAPTCAAAPNATNSVQDFNGRLWGQNDDQTSCAYKTADNSPIYYADYKRITWQESPVCRGYNKTTDGVQPDAEGRLWGYQNGANCVYINPDGTPVKDINELLPKDQEPQADTGKGSPGRRRLHQAANNANDPFVKAPICKGDPTPRVAVPDAQGRLFARQNKVLCAYRDKAGAPVFYTNYQPASWLHTPACTDPPFDVDSVADSTYKVWGWDAEGQLCAYKDEQQQPIPLDRVYNPLPWKFAPACSSPPTIDNSEPNKARTSLWGWELDRNCAFKNATTGLPLFYPGFVPGSAEFVIASVVDDPASSKLLNVTPTTPEQVPGTVSLNGTGPADHDSGEVDRPTRITGGWVIGHKKDPEIYDDEDVKDLFATGHLNKTTNSSKAASQKPEAATSPAPSKTPPANVTDVPPASPNTTANTGNKKAGALEDKKSVAKDNTTSTPVKAPGARRLHATVVASAVATSSGQGTAISTARGKASDNATAVSTSVANATAAPGGSAVAVSTSDAEATGNSTATSASNAQATASSNSTAAALVSSSANATASSQVDVRCQGIAQDNLVIKDCPQTALAANSSANAVATAGSSANAGASANAAAAANATAAANASSAATSSADAGAGAAAGASSQASVDSAATSGAAANGAASASATAAASATSWEDATACSNPPMRSSATQDDANRLWGYQDGSSCAYKTPNGSPVYYPGFKVVTWDQAPTCPGEPDINAAPDTTGRLWGYTSDDANCAYRHSDGSPWYKQGPPAGGSDSGTVQGVSTPTSQADDGSAGDAGASTDGMGQATADGSAGTDTTTGAAANAAANSTAAAGADDAADGKADAASNADTSTTTPAPANAPATSTATSTASADAGATSAGAPAAADAAANATAVAVGGTQAAAMANSTAVASSGSGSASAFASASSMAMSSGVGSVAAASSQASATSVILDDTTPAPPAAAAGSGTATAETASSAQASTRRLHAAHNAIASATATSSGGPAVATSTAKGAGDGVAVSNSTATTNGPGAAISTSSADASKGGIAVSVNSANATSADGVNPAVVVSGSSATSTDGKVAVSIVNGTAVANGAPATCYSSGTAVNNVTIVNCLNVTNVTWETAPTCPDAPTAANSVADAQGRLWGWISAAGQAGTSCCYKTPEGKPVYEVAAAPAAPASPTASAAASSSATAGASVAPSAAGPSPAGATVTGETIAEAAPSVPINPFRYNTRSYPSAGADAAVDAAKEAQAQALAAAQSAITQIAQLRAQVLAQLTSTEAAAAKAAASLQQAASAVASSTASATGGSASATASARSQAKTTAALGA